MELIGDMPISKILQDIHQFLVETLKNEVLTTHASEKRNELQRKLALIIEPRVPPSYLEMETKTKKDSTPEEYVEPNLNNNNNNNKISIEAEYEVFTDPPPEREFEKNKLTLETQTSITNLEESLSMSNSDGINASILKEKSIKYGPLLRKEKFIFMEQYKRCWAAVHCNWFHIFITDKDMKPLQSIDLNGWNARSTSSITCRDPNRRVSCFELFKPGKKTFQFVGRNSDDMIAWVKALSESSRRRQLPSLPDEDRISQEEEPIYKYDDVDANSREKIYQVIGNENEIDGSRNSNYDDIDNYRIPLYSNEAAIEEPEEIYDDVTNLQAENGRKRRIDLLIDSFNGQTTVQQMYEPVENNPSNMS